MLMQFECAILTLEDARILVEFIQKSTASKSIPVNYNKIDKSSVADLYYKLSRFLEANNQLGRLMNLDFEALDACLQAQRSAWSAY